MNEKSGNFWEKLPLIFAAGVIFGFSFYLAVVGIERHMGYIPVSVDGVNINNGGGYGDINVNSNEPGEYLDVYEAQRYLRLDENIFNEYLDSGKLNDTFVLFKYVPKVTKAPEPTTSAPATSSVVATISADDYTQAPNFDEGYGDKASDEPYEYRVFIRAKLDEFMQKLAVNNG
jgi:hypothetical protein